MTDSPAYWADGRTAHPADAVAAWPAHNRARMTQPLYDKATLDAAVAAERVRIAAAIREAWHQRQASHWNQAGEYQHGMLAGLDAAVELALQRAEPGKDEA